MRTYEYDQLTNTTAAPRPVAAPTAPRAVRQARPRRRWLTASAAVLLLPPSAALTARVLDVDGPLPLPQLLAFLPWFLVPGWLALAGGVLARRPLLTGWSLAVLGTTAWFLQPHGAEQRVPTQEPLAQVRVLTANLEFGAATESLFQALRRERPHLVSVQECDRRCAAALETAEWREAYPYRVIAGREPAEGSALLSVYPLSEESRIPGTLSMPGAVADVHGVPLRVQVVHPMPPRLGSMDAWAAELGHVRKAAGGRGETRTVFAGDFNAGQDHAAFRAVLDTGLRDAARLLGHSRTPSWPSATAPWLGTQIDHVLVSEGVVPVDGRFLDLPGTDHRALLTDLQLH